mmetsp:Transcript_12876/g.36655  ORF Transcript_12876/g.36655 Transcript_12876/m.36655 type:complete len:221 (-) Transcript_12876:58-720(-)
MDRVEIPRHLRLHSTQYLELSPTSCTDSTKDCKLLKVFAPAGPALFHLAKEHQSTPLLLNCSQEVSCPACDEANSLLWHVQHGEIPIIVIVSDVHRPRPLCHHPLSILLGTAPLHLGTTKLEDQVALEELNLSFGNASNLLFSLSAFPKDECCIVICDLHSVHTIVVGFSLPTILTVGTAAPAATPTAAPTAAPAAAAAPVVLPVVSLVIPAAAPAVRHQ